MPLFRYKARDKTSRKLVTGLIEASNNQRAVKQLRAKGLLVLAVEADRSLRITLPFLNHVSNKDRVLFARQFAVMMRAGLPIMSALKAISDQTANPVLKKTIGDLTHDIEGGTSLSEAFGRYPHAFPPIFVSVARVGEKSGKLEDVLDRLATQLEKDQELLGKIRGAMIYPVFILTALVSVMALIMIYIVPQLKGLFDDAALELPLITRAVLALSDFMSKYFIYIALVLGGIVAGIRYLIRQYPSLQRAAEETRLHLPIFGKLYRQMIMARLTHTLGTLLGSGLPMIEALNTTANVLNSPIFSAGLQEATQSVKAGETLSQSLLKDKRFPTMIGNMVAIGEKSGKIDETLETVAGFFDQEVEGLTRNLSSLLEPLLMMLMGLGVGLVVASVIVPIYNLVNAV